MTAKEQIVNFLIGRELSYTVRDIATAVGRPIASTRRYLNELNAAGRAMATRNFGLTYYKLVS